MPRRSLFAALGVVALIGVAGCGGSEDEASRCEPVSAWLLASLGDGFREEGRTLGDSAAVQTDLIEAPPSLAENLRFSWFVSADVRPKPGIETWVMSDETFRGGGGWVAGLSFLSAGGSAGPADPDAEYWRRIMARYGVSEASDGFAESRECVEKGLP